MNAIFAIQEYEVLLREQIAFNLRVQNSHNCRKTSQLNFALFHCPIMNSFLRFLFKIIQFCYEVISLLFYFFFIDESAYLYAAPSMAAYSLPEIHVPYFAQNSRKHLSTVLHTSLSIPMSEVAVTHFIFFLLYLGSGSGT